jgi:hypothetical protein
VRALEAVGGQARTTSPWSQKAKEVLRQALKGEHGEGRWAGLCNLALADEGIAGALRLPGPRARLARVNAMGVWNRTGRQVTRGSRLRLAAWGAWRIAREPFPWAGPDGYPPQVEREVWENLNMKDPPKVERLPRMGLEARVGRHGFRVGRHVEVEAVDSGEITFRPWIPLGSTESEFDSGSPLMWLVGGTKEGKEGSWVGMRGYVSVAIEETDQVR